MAHTSATQSRGITVAVHNPLLRGGASRFEVARELESYRHTVSAFGGFDTAQFSYMTTLGDMEDWFEDGLGRHIVVYDETLSVVWEGFVDMVTLRFAGLETKRGPLTQLVNRLAVVYSQVDTSTDPPTVGDRRRTAVTNDLDSQERWGIWPKVLSLAGVTDANALQLRDLHLGEYREPETSGRLSSESRGAVSVSVDCRGYIHMTDYPYRQTTVTGLIDASDKVSMILQADPNGLLGGDLTGIEANAVEVAAWENSDNLARSLLRGLAAMGNPAGGRRLFGVYEGRRALYRDMPDDWAYEMRLADPGRTIRNRVGGAVEPWSVQAGQWMMFSDLLPGRYDPLTDAHVDPRQLFIESVTYTLPFGLEVNGGKASRFNTLLARLGLGGTSV